MEKLKELYALCEASVSITYNEHKDVYESVDQFLSDRERVTDIELAPDVRKAMIERNQIIIVQAYPNTPIVFYVVYHWDLESALDEMLDVLKSDSFTYKEN